MALLAVLGVCTYGFILKGSDTIFPNVYVAGVNVGGLKRDAAINAVKLAVEQETAADTLTVVLPDRTIEFTPEVTNVALNPDEAADAAMNYGRDGGPIKALITYQKAKKDRQDIALESGKNLDTTYIRDLIDQTARACASEKIDPIVTVDADAKTVTVVTGSPKISLDADKLYDEVVARFESGDFSDLKFDYDTEPCAPVDLQTYYDQFATEMKDAYYDEEKKELVAEKVGFGFDVSYYTQQIAMADAGTTITIQAEEMQPEVTLADLEKEYFADVLGSCDSPHTAQAGRTKNLELACKAIDGTILNPGDEFSFNKIVGERTAEKGYQKAIVYQTGGKSEAEEGGNGGGSFAGRDGRRAVAAAAVAGILAMQRRWRWHRRDQERRQRPSRAAGRMTRAQVPGYEKSGEDSILPAPRFRTVSRYSSEAGRNTIMPLGRFDKSGNAMSVAGRTPGAVLRVPDTLADLCPVI